MLVPRIRLLTWVGVVVLPFTLAATVVPEAAGLAVGLIALLLALALLDAVLAWSGHDGIRVELPPVVRLFKDRPGAIPLQVRNEPRKTKRLRLGLVLPPELHSAEEDMRAVLPPEHLLSSLPWACTPRARGNYRLEQCCLESASPLGFWNLQSMTPVQSAVRVYPNLLSERSCVAALFLNRGSFGVHAARQVGKGRDFEKLRDYIPGDSFDDIHWKATAKRGQPITKVFQIERTQEIYVIIDTSRLSARTLGMGGSKSNRQKTGLDGNRNLAEQADANAAEKFSSRAGVLTEHSNAELPVLERYITSALVLGLAAERQGDLFGLVTFSDRVRQFVRAKNGKTHYGTCRDALYTLQPQIVTPDFEELASFIRVRLRRRALLVFLTDLDDPVLAENFMRGVDLIRRQHLVLVNMMQPPGVRPLFSDPRAQSINDLYQQLGGHVRWHKLLQLEKVLRRHGVRFSLLDNERMSAQLIAQYLGVKQRQIL